MPFAGVVIIGELPDVRTRCDPKLTLGSKIVRDAPAASSSETFSDWYEASIGKIGDAPALATDSSRFTTAAGRLLRSFATMRPLFRKPATVDRSTALAGFSLR
jgi:hypothetical protein